MIKTATIIMARTKDHQMTDSRFCSKDFVAGPESACGVSTDRVWYPEGACTCGNGAIDTIDTTEAIAKMTMFLFFTCNSHTHYSRH